MCTPLPWLERVPTYKEKMDQVQDRDMNTYGFLGYPVLQAADILIYKANFVPVGIDQLPTWNSTREICRRFNQFYGEVFPEPQPLMTEYPKLPGTDGRKMSKSYNNCLYLSDSPEEITKKVMQMITDPARVRRQDPGNPDVCRSSRSTRSLPQRVVRSCPMWSAGAPASDAWTTRRNC